jgi:hypothetical protein
MKMTAPTRVKPGLMRPVLSVAAVTAVLLLPATYNRFPFVFPDTSAYLSVAYADSWPIDRAGFYGLLLAPALRSLDGPPGVWLAIAMQTASVAGVLVAACRKLLPGAPAWVAFSPACRCTRRN